MNRNRPNRTSQYTGFVRARGWNREVEAVRGYPLRPIGPAAGRPLAINEGLGITFDCVYAVSCGVLRSEGAANIIFLEDIMQEVYDFLKKCQTYYLATVDGDQPRVRPFGTVALFEGKLYIQTGKAKNVSRQIKANPKVEICAFDGSAWIRIQALAIEDDRREARQHMLDAYPMLKDRYSSDDGNTQVLYLKDAVAKWESFGGEPKVINF